MSHIMPKSRRTIVKDIIAQEAKILGISDDDFLDNNSSSIVVAKRHEAVMKAFYATGLSFCEISRLFHRHHSTIRYIINKIRNGGDVVSKARQESLDINPIEKIYRGCRSAGVSSEPDGRPPRKRTNTLVGYAGKSRRKVMRNKLDNNSIVDCNAAPLNSSWRH